MVIGGNFVEVSNDYNPIQKAQKQNTDIDVVQIWVYLCWSSTPRNKNETGHKFTLFSKILVSGI